MVFHKFCSLIRSFKRNNVFYFIIGHLSFPLFLALSFLSQGASVSWPKAMIKYPDRRNSEEKGFVLAHHPRYCPHDKEVRCQSWKQLVMARPQSGSTEMRARTHTLLLRSSPAVRAPLPRRMRPPGIKDLTKKGLGWGKEGGRDSVIESRTG